MSWDDGDVIDMLGFFWRSRAITFSGLALGALSGLALWFLTHSVQNEPSDAPDRWLVTLSSVADEGNPQGPLAAFLSNYLKTREGAQVFYNALADVLDRKEFQQNYWVDRQAAGSGFIGTLESIGSSTSVMIQNEAHVTEKDLRQALPHALNAVVDSFNMTYFVSENSLIKKMIATQIKMAAIKIKAFQAFHSHAGKKINSSEAPLLGSSGENYLSTKPAAIALLLAGSPITTQQKAEILAEYRKLYATYDSLQTQIKNLDKNYGFENLTALNKFTTTTEIMPIFAPQQTILLRIFAKLPIALALGLLLGGMAGVLLSLLLNYWHYNSSRLRRILQNN
jgi:hypothetical protein